MSGLGSCQSRVSLPSVQRNREDFGYSSQQHLYVCAQKPQKIHPDFDHILADILRRDSRGVVVLVEDEYQTAGNNLRRRIRSSMPDVADRVTFAPRLEFSDYLCLLNVADVLLDPLHYGGGMTLYDWASYNKPLVTWPSELLRGRYAVGFYSKMQLSSCIAQTLDEYVDIAVAIGTDALYRSGIEAEIRAASDVIFEDAAIVEEHKRVFEWLIEKSRDGS